MASVTEKLVSEFKAWMKENFVISLDSLQEQSLADRCALIVDKIGSSAEVDKPLHPLVPMSHKGRACKTMEGYAITLQPNGEYLKAALVQYDDNAQVDFVDPGELVKAV